MIRPRLLLLLPLAAVLAAGCTTFTDNDAVARFDDTELGAEELTELMDALAPPGTQSEPTNATAARETISLWVRIEAVRRRLADNGVAISEQARGDAAEQMASAVPRFDELSGRMQDYLVDAQAAFLTLDEAPPPTDEERRDVYDRGPAASDIACVAHILVDTKDEADAVLTDLAAGAEFAALAAERSTDTGSGAQGGVLPCAPTDSFRSTYVEPFVEAALAAEVGVPTDPVATDFGFHIIRVRPYDEIVSELDFVFSPLEFAISRSIEQADVTVDPRYGTLDGSSVVPLR